MPIINLPPRFKTKLDGNDNLDGIVKATLGTFGSILKESKLYFFNEYTDHGPKHIQDVIFSSDNLITDDTFDKILSDKDIGYYILSVVLHDIGMHIDLQGFIVLIEGGYDDIRVTELDNRTWKTLWEDFLNEARKFSGKQLKSVFGDEATIIKVPPLSKPGEISENDKKLIGEFIRRHHPRLAHEIAIKGFPNAVNPLVFANSLDLKSKNIIGLIARSHGVNLRICTDYIESIYGKASRRFPNGIHATYLMVLLRIADYIQIDSNRTSNVLIKTKTFSSSISELEHHTHLAIDDVNYKWHDDPERIFVTASPKDSKMYLKLKKLFKNIQYEFDISWAVMGELYGNMAEEKPQIKYRRITSNLDDDKFSERQDYVADAFLFKTNEEIIKLMVAPLYGDDMKYGVRELMQNSIDATKEREFIENKLGNDNYKPLIEIRVTVENEITYFTIRDNGVGMDKDIIKNYFLSAGASYRKSLEWQKEFTDDQGKSFIRRSGRFGVGILSAFLIGQEIYVESKKINETEGYKFFAGLNTNHINVLKDNTIGEGTYIKIKIDENKINNFKISEFTNSHSLLPWYKWYSLSNPVVKYYLYDEEIIPYKILDPDNVGDLPFDWNKIDSNGYNNILWTFSKRYADTEFTCNGIVIPEIGYNTIDLGPIYNMPKISVFDDNAILPLALDRNTISDELSFRDDLLEDIYKDLIAYMLVFSNAPIVKNKIILSGDSKLEHPGVGSGSYSYYYESLYGINYYNNNGRIAGEMLNTILISKKGFILNYNYFIQKLKNINLVLMQLVELPEILELDIKDRFLLITDNKINSIDDYTRAIEANNWNREKGITEPFNSRIFMRTDKYKYLFTSSKRRVSVWLNNMCKVKSENKMLTNFEIEKPKPSIITNDFLEKNSGNIHFIREHTAHCYFEGDKLLNNLLQRYIGDDVLIPYSMEERKKKYPLAFKELERYMNKYITTVI